MSVFRNLLTSRNVPVYTEVNYLKGKSFNLNQNYVDTLYVPNNNTKIEIKYEFTNESHSYDRILGSEHFWAFTVSGQELYFSITGTNADWQTSSIAQNTPHIIIADRQSITVDGVLKKTISPAQITTNNSIWLFGMNYSNSNRDSKAKIYYCKIWESNTLVRDIIPVLDGNNTPCMYDKVTNTFYYNKGEGSFAWG